MKYGRGYFYAGLFPDKRAGFIIEKPEDTQAAQDPETSTGGTCHGVNKKL